LVTHLKFIINKYFLLSIYIKKYKYDEELQKTVRVAESEAEYKDILKDAVITRVANSGSQYIEQTTKYNVTDFEADYDYPVYKYVVDGVEHFSNFQFANYVDIIYPINNSDDTTSTI